MHRAAHAYLQTQVTTTGQGDVVVLLYDGAIKFLNKAKDLLAQNDMAGKGLNISKTLDIISELEASLNREKGGELAKNLHGLYTFCQSHLIKANIKKSPEMIDDVIRVLSGLRSAYAEILAMPEAQAAAREAAANLGTKAMTMSRNNPGVAVPGSSVPSPGGGARVRAMYAKASGEQAQTMASAGQEASVAASGTLSPEGVAENSGDALKDAGTGAGMANSTDKAERAEKIAAPETSVAAEENDTPPPLLPGMGGFASRLGDPDMFKRYAAMRK